jgi:ubiquitin-protein ligase
MDRHHRESSYHQSETHERQRTETTGTLLIRSQLINDNIFEWSVALIVLNPDSLYYGGYFKAKLSFPKNYPYSPPGKRLLYYSQYYIRSKD